MKKNFFVIVAGGLDPTADATYNAFFEAGCDDAAIAWEGDVFTLAFQREADRFEHALISAYRDVTKAGATVKRFEPDSLVTLTEITERSGVSAEDVGGFRADLDKGFPAPSVRIGSADPLWNWSDVAIWLQRRQLVHRDVAVEARAIWEANTTLLLRDHQGADFEAAFGGMHPEA